jgi:signal transduction histidine kinase
MIPFERLLPRRRTAGLLGIAACLLIVLLAWAGYIAVREWERSVLLLANQQAGETADRFLNQVSRDMQGVQRGVLLSPELDGFTSQEPPADPSYEAVNLVASAFARYSYPESFFLWRRAAGAPPTFFYRQERRPPWSRDPGGPRRFPVVIDDQSPVGAQLLDLIRRESGQRRPFAVIETVLDGTPYQIVARLFYRDPLRQNIDTVFGFLVNLAWTRQHYFSGLLDQAFSAQTFSNDDTSRGVSLAVFDDQGVLVAGSDDMPAHSTAPSERPLRLMFFNPLLVAAEPPSAQQRRGWIIRAEARRDSTLVAAAGAARRMLLLQIVAAAMLVAGIALSVRAAGARLRLAELRSDFVASVTHEFKTPIATIRAAGETLAEGRLENASAQRDYAGYIVHEARRLTRLVDNLLAFSRLTDSDIRQPVERVVLAELVAETLGRFSVPLAALGFQVEVSVPQTLPLVLGDPGALELMLDNIVDNAIRHSRNEHRLAIRATAGNGTVCLEVRDSGGGIPPDEIQHVTKKFFRGRHAGHGGTGLGLAITARVIADHGGTLAIDSEPGIGTTIRVGLPAMREQLLAAVKSGAATEARRGA